MNEVKAGLLLEGARLHGGHTILGGHIGALPDIGFIVGVRPEQSVKFALVDAPFTRTMHWLRDVLPTIDGDSDMGVGSWLDASGTLVLDVVRWYPSRSAALAAATEAQQDAIFNLETGEAEEV